MSALAAPWLLLPFLFLAPGEATDGAAVDRGSSQYPIEVIHESRPRPISAASRTGDSSRSAPGAEPALGADASSTLQAGSPIPFAGLQGTPDPSPEPADNGPVDEDDDGISGPLLIGIGLLIIIGLAAGWVLAGRRGLK